jgi:vesicular inhibitory amino acid transporter
VLIDGLIKGTQPGSLRTPATTYLFPQNWQTIPLAFGLLMCKSLFLHEINVLTLLAPWGGHSVFPNIYRDMRHPYKYHRAVDTTYLLTFTLDMGMAIIGRLMFGDDVHDEITSNILLTKGYPMFLNYVIVICIAIIPLTKVPLNARPIVSTVEVLTGLHNPGRSESEMTWTITAGKVLIRVVTIALFVFISVIFPAFDRIMTLLGAVCCFSICIVLPVAFHLKLFSKDLTKRQRMLDWSLLIISSIMAVVSTIFACLPRDFLRGDV